MTIAPDIEAQILRYFHVERWRLNTIARQLHVHHSTVRRVLTAAGVPRPDTGARPSIVDAYTPFILATLERFPTLTAARLFGMAQARGYAGSASHFRHRVALLRPHAAPPRRTCGCARCLASRRRSTGRTSVTCRSAARAAR